MMDRKTKRILKRGPRTQLKRKYIKRGEIYYLAESEISVGFQATIFCSPQIFSFERNDASEKTRFSHTLVHKGEIFCHQFHIQTVE